MRVGASLETYLASTRVDAVLLRVPTMRGVQPPRRRHERGHRGGGAALRFVPDAAQAPARRVGRAPRRHRMGVVGERALGPLLTKRRRGEPRGSAARRAAPATFGSDDAAWRHFAAEPFEMWGLTSSLYRVEPSDGVHADGQGECGARSPARYAPAAHRAAAAGSRWFTSKLYVVKSARAQPRLEHLAWRTRGCRGCSCSCPAGAPLRVLYGLESGTSFGRTQKVDGADAPKRAALPRGAGAEPPPPSE